MKNRDNEIPKKQMVDDNIFDEIEQQSSKKVNETDVTSEDNISNNEQKVSDEIDIDNLDDTAVGENKKYERESLDKQVVKIKHVKLFNPDRENDEVITSLSNKDVKYYKTKFIITFDKKNKDGVNHREYLSGAIQYIQKDGSLSQPMFWYKGTNSQVGKLWERVAEFKGVEPEDLSPREFVSFLNSGVKAEIEYADVEFRKQKYKKNLIKKFVE